MKKMTSMLTALILVCLLVSGCNGNSTEFESQINELSAKVSELEAENTELKAKLTEYEEIVKEAKEAEGQAAEEEKTSEEQKKKTVPIQLNEVIQIENYCEFELVSVDFSKKVLPPNPSAFYSYYEVKENGNTYLDVKFRAKSLLTIGKDADELIGVRVFFDGVYDYTGFSIIEKDGGGNLGSAFIERIDPLMTVVLHELVEVPDEVNTSGKPISVIITAEGRTYEYQMR